jgi:hypothetical protein
MTAVALWNKLNAVQRETLCGLPFDGSPWTPAMRKLARLQLVERAPAGWRATPLGHHVACPPLCFLDMDGVCARVIDRPKYAWESDEAWKARQATAFERIDAPSMRRLNAIAERTGALFVMSSTWRLAENATPEGYQRVMREKGFAGKLVGFTPVVPNGSRWMEIELYLKRLHTQPRAIVVLEDFEPMGPLTPRTVVTDDVRLITDANVERAVALLTT